MTPADWLGSLAGALTTIAFVPQVVKIWVTRSAEDISTWMFGIFTIGIVLWLIYGVVLGSGPIIVANAVTLALASAIIVLKFHFRKKTSAGTRAARRTVSRAKADDPSGR